MLCLPGACAFCNVSKENGFDILMEREHFIVFKDYKPGAAQHLQVVTREHIESVKLLSSEDIGLVNAMRDLGEEALTLLNVPWDQRRFGFHIPPFTSQMHLHLHCFGLPFKNSWRRAKYHVSEGPNGKGWSWFAEISQCIRILEKGGRVTVTPEKSRY